jgi:penicillin-binding protein 1A
LCRESVVRVLARAVGLLLRFGFRLGLVAAGALIVYTADLVGRLDVSRAGLEARARSVEANVVLNRVAGSGGRYFDTPLELPLSLPPERIPDFVANAFIVREDQQFRWHFGINPVALARAAASEVRRLAGAEGSDARPGGSTITMQLVKNLILHQEKTYDRKLREIILAVVVEALFSKSEILAMYLNTAYFGEGTYGIEAAARKFFGRSVGYEPKVDMLEAAMLAHSLWRPSVLNPATQRNALKAKARELIAAMSAEGYDVPDRYEARARGQRTWSLNAFPYRDLAMRFMVPAELSRIEDRVVLGFTIDTEAQLYAELAASDLLKRGREAGYDSSAIVVLEPDGAVAALATGHDYDGVDLVRNGRVSPGSALKPFMVLCALKHGMRPDSIVEDRRREFRPGWIVRNFDGRYLGPITLKTALMRSRNASAVELHEQFGGRCFEEALAGHGIQLENPRAPTAVLGSEHVSLLDLAAAYASLAQGGRKVEPYAVRYARIAKGPIVYRRDAPPVRPEITADRAHCDLLGMLRSVTSSKGTGHNAAFSHPVWGKTGTSQGYRDALFVGFTGRYVAAVWLGRRASGAPSGQITGGELPAEAFRWLMATLHDGKAPIELECRRRIDVAGTVGAPG